MTLMLFFGCTLISFGPISSLFTLFVCRSSIRQVLFFVGSFFSLLSMAFASFLWFAISPLTQTTTYTLPFSVFIMEACRFFCFQITKKVRHNFLSQLNEGDLKLHSRHKISLVFGVGFGTVSGFITMPVILQQLTGPGNFGLVQSQSQYFAVCSSALCMLFTLMHCCWTVIMFEAFQVRNHTWAAAILFLHLLASSSTLFNKAELYAVSLSVVVVIFIVSFAWAAKVAGMTKQSVYNTLTLSQSQPSFSGWRNNANRPVPTNSRNSTAAIINN